MRMHYLLALPLAAAVAAGGAYGYAWHQTRQQADRLVEAIKPLAEMRYQGVHIGLDGEASIRGVSITPHAYADTVEIDALSLRAPSAPALLAAFRELTEGRLPAELELSIAGATLDLNGPLGDALADLDEAAGGSASLTSLLPAELEALGCGPVRHFGVRQLRAMGYAAIRNDITLAYRLDRDNRNFTLRVAGDTDGMTAIEAELEFGLESAPERAADVLAAAPTLRRATLRQSDIGLNERRREYCARQSDRSPEDYLAEHLRLAARWLARHDLNPGPGVMASYARLIEPASRLEVVIAPAEPLAPMQLASYDPAQWLALLQPRLSVNGEQAPLAELLEEPDTELAAATPQQPQAPQFRPVDFGRGAQLSEHLYRDVRLVTRSGVDHEGRLVGIEGNVLAIEKRLRGGNMRFRVPLSELRSLEVWH